MSSNQRLRARFVLICVVIAALLLAGKLFVVQLADGEEYVARADKQYARPYTSVFDRGSIFLSSKSGDLSAAAALTKSYTLYISPKLISDPQSVYDALSHYVDLDMESFMARASRSDDPYEEIAPRVDANVAQSIMDLGITGVGLTAENRRSYPGGKLASHVIGLIGEDQGVVRGRYGLERTYEDVLARPATPAGSDAFARFLFGARDAMFGSASDQGDIVTTIEPTVEAYLEKVLGETSAQWKPDEIGGIIMDPKTGEIVAASSLPDFDPGNTAGITNVSVFSNPLVENAYEMGSIMKPLTVAVGLDTAAITPTSTYDDTGSMMLSGKKISNFDSRARGVVPVQEILSQSLNVGAATVALKVGKEDFSNYFKSFGFGEKTGIDQPNETAGLTANLKTGRDIEIATMSYGQGIAISPVAMTRALAVLADRGLLVEPHFVSEIRYSDGSVKKIPTKEGQRVLKEETAAQVTRMLVKVVDTALRNGALKMDRYSIAAKTGTAQVADPVTKGYYPDRYLHSFFGYFPAYEPRFIVFLYQKYPKGAQYASETLAEPFHELTKFLIDYYDVPPDR